MSSHGHDTGDRPLGFLPWLVCGALLVHVLEEWPRFPEWATRHFGSTPPEYFVVSHVPIIGIVAWAAARASSRSATHQSIAFLGVILAALGANAIFHLGTTIGFREYSPGLVTALCVYLPLVAYLFPRIAGTIGKSRAMSAALAGTLVSILITATLALEIH